jgi:hypothetical protein
MTHDPHGGATGRFFLAAAALLLAAAVGGCGPKKATVENVAVSPMEARDTSISDVTDLRRLAGDKLSAASALALTLDEEAKVAQAQDAKQRGDDFFDLRAYNEAKDAYQQSIGLCDAVIAPHAGG